MVEIEISSVWAAKIEAAAGMTAYALGSFVTFAAGAVEASRQFSYEIALQRPASVKELVIGGAIVAAGGVATYLHGSNRLAQIELEGYKNDS